MHPSRARLFRLLLVVLAFVLFACNKSEPQAQPVAPSVKPEPSLAASPSAPVASAAPSAPAAAPSASSAPAPKAAWAKPFLWRIEGTKPSYVFGTIHVPDGRLEPLLPAVDHALMESDVVNTEIPLEADNQLAMVSKLMLPANKTLKTELPPEIYTRVAAVFEEKGMPIEPLSKLKPWAIAPQMMLLDRLLTMATKKPLDMRIYAQGKEAGKTMGGLETLDEQLAIFDGLTKAEQAHMVKSTLDLMAKMKKEGKDAIEEIMLPYLSGEPDRTLAKLNESMDLNDPLDVKFMKRLITDRNKSMSDRIAAKIKAAPGKGHFFAVGAAHLLGPTGIVATLGARGMKLTRVE